MRWADVYVCMLADGVALRNRCPQGQADPRAAIAGGASGVTMARAGPHPRRARSMRWADVYVRLLAPGAALPTPCPQRPPDPRGATAGCASAVAGPRPAPAPPPGPAGRRAGGFLP